MNSFSLHRTFPHNKVENDATRAVLQEYGIVHESWRDQLPESSNILSFPQVSPLALYRHQLNQVKAQYELDKARLDSFSSDNKRLWSLRDQDLSEHTHARDEVRLFLSGEALLFVHLGERIIVLFCVEGDFVRIPAGCKHWLDMGPDARLDCIRWYQKESDLQNQYTGNFIAELTPRWEAIMASSNVK